MPEEGKSIHLCHPLLPRKRLNPLFIPPSVSVKKISFILLLYDEKAFASGDPNSAALNPIAARPIAVIEVLRGALFIIRDG